MRALQTRGLGIILAASFLFLSPSTFAKGKTFEFGVMLPLTGPVADAGEEQRDIIEFALSQINQKGGDQFVAIYANDRCNIPAEPNDSDYNNGDYPTALTAYDSLVDDAKVNFILGTICSGAAGGLPPDPPGVLTGRNLVKDHVVMLSAQNSNAALLDGRTPNYFSLSYSDNDIARGIAEAMCAAAAGGSVADITEQVPFTQSLRCNDKGTGVLNFLGVTLPADCAALNPPSTSICQDPPTLVSDQTYPSSTTDFSDYAANLKSANADAIFVNANVGATGDLLFDAMEEVGPFNQLVASGVLNAKGVLQKDTQRVEFVEGMIIIDAPQITADLPIGPLANTPDYYIASTLDAVDILTSLIAQFHGNAKKVRNAIATETFEGFISEVTSSGDIFFGGETFVQGIVAAKFIVQGGEAIPQ